MSDPFGGRHEITAEEWLAVVGRNDDAPVITQKPQDAPESTETIAKTMLGDYLERGGFGRVEREVRCWPGRRFRADWFLVDQQPQVIVEYDGMMRGSAHASVTGALRDSEKSNLAQTLGYRFYRVNARTVHDGSAFTFLESVLRRIDG